MIKGLELKLPPGLLFILMLGLMWLAPKLLPALGLPQHLMVAGFAWLLATLGLGVVGAAGLSFLKYRTTLSPTRLAKASRLITSGMYQFSRNPIYLGLLLILIAYALYQSHLLALLLLPAFVAYITRFQIMPEERVLRATFAADYDAYAARVRRWL